MIVILEDNVDRRAAMRLCLIGSPHEVVFLHDAEEMKRFLEEHWLEVSVLSLDHDLDLIPNDKGGFHDPGTGRVVADYLAQKEPACPVVIHTSNSIAAVGMEMVLRKARWRTIRVTPFEDLAWVHGEWARTIKRIVSQ